MVVGCKVLGGSALNPKYGILGRKIPNPQARVRGLGFRV